MTQKFKIGDKVKWSTISNKYRKGIIKDVYKTPYLPSDPQIQYLVKPDDDNDDLLFDDGYFNRLFHDLEYNDILKGLVNEST